MLGADLKFRENPPDGGKGSAQYRLWSQVTVTGRCQAGKVVEWSIAAPEIAFGKEGPLDAVGEFLTPLSAQPGIKGSTPQASISFQYAVKGRPHLLTTPAFDGIRPRACTWIWHKVNATVACSGNTLVVRPSLTASGFPTHRLWQDGKLTAEIPQGPFENLWICSSTPGLVN
jgi:hypothetical protein